MTGQDFFSWKNMGAMNFFFEKSSWNGVFHLKTDSWILRHIKYFDQLYEWKLRNHHVTLASNALARNIVSTTFWAKYLATNPAMVSAPKGCKLSFAVVAFGWDWVGHPVLLAGSSTLLSHVDRISMFICWNITLCCSRRYGIRLYYNLRRGRASQGIYARYPAPKRFHNINWDTNYI